MHSAQALYRQTKAYARDHSWKSWWCVLSTAFLLSAAMAGTLPVFPLYLRVASSFLAGLLSLRMFVIYHDQQHRAILPRSRLAEFFMRLFGMWALSPSSIWRSSHDHHHAHNSKLLGSHIGSYPIMTKEQYQKSPAGIRFKYLFMRHPLTILFGYFFVFHFGMVVNPFFNAPRRHYDCLLALVLHVALAVTLVCLFGWLTWVFALEIPLFIAAALGSYLFYAQHNFPGVSFNDKAGWTFEKAALESSSFLKTNPVMAWFTANIGYHHIHHLNHRVPFYRLPELYRDIPELQRAKTTSLSPIQIFRCLRLKVWDVDLQRMVGVRGL
ncbi:MAG TPA: fatty acid desaturase [Candidatus Acidoferrales bacterium]|nr:fatty acid desaturase [Candidatus Acidoferrales bacterium]